MFEIKNFDTEIEKEQFNLQKELAHFNYRDSGTYLDRYDRAHYDEKIKEIADYDRESEEVTRACEIFNREGFDEEHASFLFEAQEAYMRNAGASETQIQNQLAHLKEVYQSAEEYNTRGLGVIDPVTLFVIAIHDSAKFTPKYSAGGEMIQEQNGTAMPFLVEHEEYSALAVPEWATLFEKKFERVLSSECIKEVQATILAHGEGEFPRDFALKIGVNPREHTQTTTRDMILGDLDKLTGARITSFSKYYEQQAMNPAIRASIAEDAKDYEITFFEAALQSSLNTTRTNYFRLRDINIQNSFGREAVAEAFQFKEWLFGKSKDAQLLLQELSEEGEAEDRKKKIHRFEDAILQFKREAMPKKEHEKEIFYKQGYDLFMNNERTQIEKDIAVLEKRPANAYNAKILNELKERREYIRGV